ncbi:hypothetical protein LSO07_11875 [Janthinobacterium sp. PLB04]|uniref:Uncharacterized protein n=1 Tax=Janthinobacterium lividum TaxID=29581 RepID=A0AAJ4MWI7_9BURK|nr:MULTISPECIES: hypothetical protein [Janthinobacterium]KAB0324450.1 hypothetical protein F3B38_11930 [Janthinobacterium lividum]QSX98551.1 hypothetical protein J3P46_12030 [Janthinobacterium lividum]UGQ38514.1 hypothetical protein LSO07_11875 [Janthinobacterium sp. PLB04]
MHLPFLPVLAILALSHIAAHADTQADTPADAAADTSQSVHVSSIRNPELKSYRVMAAGLDAFDDHHALAPRAREVRFQLIPGPGVAADALWDATLRIVGNETAISVPLSADGSFVLPRSAQADSDDADLVTNQKKDRFRWQASVRSDDVPPGMRRLGDLRLQCQVGIAIAKKEMPFLLRTLVATKLRATDWCSAIELKMSTYSDPAIASATLLDGGRRVALQVKNGGTSFLAPLGDTRYADDTLIELVYQQDAASAPSAVP